MIMRIMPLDFLGFFFRGLNDTEMIEPSAKSTKRVLAVLKGKIMEYAERKPHMLAEIINPILRGWANYHRYVSERGSFKYVDAMVNLYMAEYGVKHEARKLIISISETSIDTFVGVPSGFNPYEAHCDGLYENWESYWLY